MTNLPREHSLDPLALPMQSWNMLSPPTDARSTSGCSQRWDLPVPSIATKHTCSSMRIAASLRPMIKRSKLT